MTELVRFLMAFTIIMNMIGAGIGIIRDHSFGFPELFHAVLAAVAWAFMPPRNQRVDLRER